jgi:catechol 2,3-dioxygenase-like lactoylglutathione lyase family enzyme
MTLSLRDNKNAKLIGPNFIALQVRDLEASKAFYVERMGLTPIPQSPPGAVVFKTEPVPFGIRKPLVDLDATSLLGWGVSLWIAATDADVLHAQLSEAAVPIVLPLANGPFGRFFAFRDPDGYTITVSTAQPNIARTTLDPKGGYLTFINTFTVEPDNAERLLQALRDATEEIPSSTGFYFSESPHKPRSTQSGELCPMALQRGLRCDEQAA